MTTATMTKDAQPTKTLLCGCGETLCSDHAPRPQKETTMTKDEQFQQQDQAITREMDSHAEKLKRWVEMGCCPHCHIPFRIELNERNITFKCWDKKWQAIYPIRAIGNSERAMRDESLDLVAIAEREVLDVARKIATLWRQMGTANGGEFYAAQHALNEAQCELLASVVLLESREQVRNQIEAEAAKNERLLALMP